MSTERFGIECRDGYIIVDGCEYYDHGDFVLDLVTAIRQQARDLDQLRIDLAAAVAKRDEWASGAARLSSQLGNLLAVIHRDGGHYESEHGTEKACADAMQRICDTRAGLGVADELAMLVRRLAHALQKAAPDSDLPKTAMDYLSIAGLAGSPMRRDE